MNTIGLALFGMGMTQQSQTCSRYADQLSAMQKALSVMEGHVQSLQLSATAKQRIAQKLQQAKLN